MLGVVLALHLTAGLLHGAPHSLAAIDLQDWQWAFIAVVTIILPILGFLVVWRTQRNRLGAAVFAVSLGAAFVFGVTYHFTVPNPDHVHSVTDAWSLPFLATALLVAATDLLGVFAGAWVVYREN